MFPRYLLIFLLFTSSTFARQGMWLPQLLKELNESEMKSMGMQISADDIYSINHSSLMDAIVQFGAGCTGEVVSDRGLLITNHHCGFSQIQSLSTIEKNFLADGYWSRNGDEELPCPGLTVTFIKEIRDVSAAMLAGISDTLNEESRQSFIKSRTDSIEKSIGGKQKGFVRSFYYGNKYYLFLIEIFTDIRFVGAPPQSIGKFGGETDNWTWPAHVGEFALFRIYSDTNNLPAAFSKNNVPYKPRQFLTINAGGIKEDDFVLVAGFPGRTSEYILSPALKTIANQTNPNRIEIREARLNILRDEMKRNDTVRLLNAPKFSTLENSYKKWQGELIGFRKFDAINKKIAEEKNIYKLLKNNKTLSADTILFSVFDSLTNVAMPYNFANDFFVEAFPGMDIINQAIKFRKLMAMNDSIKTDTSVIYSEARRLNKELDGFYKTFRPGIDKRNCEAMLSLTWQKMNADYSTDLSGLKDLFPEEIRNGIKKFGSVQNYVNVIFSQSMFTSKNKLFEILISGQRKNFRKISQDPAYMLAISISKKQKEVQSKLELINKELNSIQRKYMFDLLALDSSKSLFPDANLTLRISYGKVEGMSPADGIRYEYFTTADGILDKSKTGNEDYRIPLRLTEIIEQKDYGNYGKNGVLNVAFLTSSHTTGGSSGSPVLNGKGELVGVNYDRMWEGVLSDYYYDERYCRNISLDIRYALFIIDKYSNAKRFIDEMRIAK